jgi:putative NADPH-quinone reductase
MHWLAVALLAIQFPIGWFRLPQLLSEVIDFIK